MTSYKTDHGFAGSKIWTKAIRNAFCENPKLQLQLHNALWLGVALAGGCTTLRQSDKYFALGMTAHKHCDYEYWQCSIKDHTGPSSEWLALLYLLQVAASTSDSWQQSRCKPWWLHCFERHGGTLPRDWWLMTGQCRRPSCHVQLSVQTALSNTARHQPQRGKGVYKYRKSKAGRGFNSLGKFTYLYNIICTLRPGYWVSHNAFTRRDTPKNTKYTVKEKSDSNFYSNINQKWAL